MSKNDAIARQIAALPVRWDKEKRLRLLMVTSRDTGRWVMPKGWLMDGRKPWLAAEIEALEEAGAVGAISKVAIGRYHYLKQLGDGAAVLCRVTVYPMTVEKLKRNWKERGQRQRHWFSPREAARLVEEGELSELLLGLTEAPKRRRIIAGMRKAP